MSAKKVLTLLNKGALLGVYTSAKELAKGVNYWMEFYPKEILSFEEWNLNYSPEPNSWGWAYVPPRTALKRLTRGGASFIPMKKFFGHNLIEYRIRGVKTHYEIQ
jgi:hypothetical protein